MPYMNQTNNSDDFSSMTLSWSVPESIHSVICFRNHKKSWIIFRYLSILQFHKQSSEHHGYIQLEDIA